MLKFIVLADLHIVAEGSLSHGLDTTDRLNKAIDFVNTNHADADFVIVAGDLADRGDLPAYQRFEKAITRLELPVHLTLGNHDDRTNFLSHFGPDLAAETGNVDHVIDLKGQRIIVLDSSDRSVGGSGLLETSQLAWLQARLDEARDVPVIIVLHHNITRLHTQNDFIILKDNAEFAGIVGSHPDIRQVISGHVHMTTAGTYKGIPFCTLAGCHYSIDPTLESRSGPRPSPVARREGPGELAVVLSDGEATVVHMEKFIDRHLVIAQELFP
ncbi:metallophosphoesterase [Hoeflea sp.]|uniref:metallophosphoesterase n=1 Tax=Hoeflea sp. TaxID=1940281 RepID=UPI00199527C2|nr:metallophosphoesterase [Hoeflea sp.]MBC7282219.1 metallophosphoesterase [Hoeflea sp.]